MQYPIFCMLFLLFSNPAIAADWKKVGGQGLMQFVLVEQKHEEDVSVYNEAIKSLCHQNQRCYLLFWSDENKVPLQLPMSDASVTAQTASYTFNPVTNYRRLLFNCRINPDPDTCLSD